MMGALPASYCRSLSFFVTKASHLPPGLGRPRTVSMCSKLR